MVGAFLLKVFLLQVLVITVIVFVLKAVLGRQLIESALKKFELMKPDSFEPDPSEIVVITANGELNELSKKRLSDNLVKRFGKNIPLTLRKDGKIQGGVIIKSRKLTIDNSILTRLKESGMVR